MSKTPPLPALDYAGLFSDPRMFDSSETLTRAGFTLVKRRSSDESIMVVSHPSVPSYLFKKFGRCVDRGAQRENYRARVRGADEIRSLIAEYRLDRLVVVHKWIYELPPPFREHKRCPELLVVERLDLLSKKASNKRYRAIDPVTLVQLCRVLHAFSGLDAAIHNLRFTTSGQVAFFDTESWDRSPRPFDRVFKYLREQLTRKSMKIAERTFDRLDDE